MTKNGRLHRILILSGASLATALALSLIAMVAGKTTAIIVLVVIMWLSVWRIVGNNRKEAASVKAQLEASRANTDAIFERLCGALGMRDTVRDRELERLSWLASILVRQMRVPTEQAAIVDQAAALRDVGKRGVAESVLLKEEDFTEQDWREMKRHPETYLNLDLKEMGAGGIDSWSPTAYPMMQYRIPSDQSYSYSYRLTPVE